MRTKAVNSSEPTLLIARATTLPLRLIAPITGTLPGTDATAPGIVAVAGLAATVTLMPVLGLSAHKGFVNLDNATQLLRVLFHKGDANAVAHIPSGFIGPQSPCSGESAGR